MRLQEYLDRKGSKWKTTTVARLRCLAGYDGDPDAGPAGAQSRMVHNIWNEMRLRCAVWRGLCEGLRNAPEEPADVHVAVTQWARTPGSALAGPPVDRPTTCVYATCVTKWRFCTWLRKQGLPFATQAEAENWVNRLLDQPDVVSHRQELEDVLLKRFLMWATFDPDDHTCDPRSSLPATANSVRACLGLATCDEDDDLLVICYTLPTRVVARFPVVTTACASTPWAEYWAPADPGEPWGWTQPWPNTNQARRPEVVHECITGATLALPLCEIWP